MTTPAQQLESEVWNHLDRVVILAGAGIARSADSNPCATWIGLLEDGISYCRSHCHNLSARWFDITAQMIAEASSSELIQAATRIDQALQQIHPGEFGRWLSQSVGSLKLRNRTVIDALLRFNCQILTTNYDNLFEDASYRKAVTWTQGPVALQVLRGDATDILHLHGHYRTPNSVVFGARSYEDICGDVAAQNLLRSVLTLKTIIFVGCGTGVEDPNFGGLLEWSKTALSNSSHSHYHLVCEHELVDFTKIYKGLPVTPVVYGRSYEDLSPFLTILAARLALDSTIETSFDKLASCQSDFDTQRRALVAQNLPAAEHLLRSFQIAKRLWDSGGRRTAALYMDSSLSSKSKQLSQQERLDFGLEAVEYLLDDDLEYQAGELLKSLGEIIEAGSAESDRRLRFHTLLSRYLAMTDSSGVQIDGIQRLASFVGPDEVDRLRAETSEAFMLKGDLYRAVNPPPQVPQC